MCQAGGLCPQKLVCRKTPRGPGRESPNNLCRPQAVATARAIAYPLEDFWMPEPVYFAVMILPTSVAWPPLSPWRILEMPTSMVLPTDLPQNASRSSGLSR